MSSFLWKSKKPRTLGSLCPAPVSSRPNSPSRTAAHRTASPRPWNVRVLGSTGSIYIEFPLLSKRRRGQLVVLGDLEVEIEGRRLCAPLRLASVPPSRAPPSAPPRPASSGTVPPRPWDFRVLHSTGLIENLWRDALSPISRLIKQLCIFYSLGDPDILDLLDNNIIFSGQVSKRSTYVQTTALCIKNVAPLDAN